VKYLINIWKNIYYCRWAKPITRFFIVFKSKFSYIFNWKWWNIILL